MDAKSIADQEGYSFCHYKHADRMIAAVTCGFNSVSFLCIKIEQLLSS